MRSIVGQERAFAPKVKIGIVGDLHGAFDAEDARYFNRSDYDLLLLTGDLGSGTAQNGIGIAREVARLDKPTLVVAGNNDAPYAAEISAEFKYQARLAALMRVSRGRGEQESSVALCGYDLRTYTFSDYSFSVLVGRPYSRGGPDLFHPSGLAERYGVFDQGGSEALLSELVRAAPTRDIVWLAHNGPSGLGDRGTDIFGADFRKEGGDWGDRDLEAAVRYSKEEHRVLAVIAGHMHRRPPRPGAERERTAQLEKDGTLYVNASVVPRIFNGAKSEVRHHMALELYADGPPVVRDVWVEEAAR